MDNVISGLPDNKVSMMDSSRLAWTVSDSRCLLPVTALEFCFFHQSRILISGKFVIRIDYLEDPSPPPGEGPLVKIFSEDGQLMCIQEALPFRRVHGIRSGKICDQCLHSPLGIALRPHDEACKLSSAILKLCQKRFSTVYYNRNQ